MTEQKTKDHEKVKAFIRESITTILKMTEKLYRLALLENVSSKELSVMLNEASKITWETRTYSYKKPYTFGELEGVINITMFDHPLSESRFKKTIKEKYKERIGEIRLEEAVELFTTSIKEVQKGFNIFEPPPPKIETKPKEPVSKEMKVPDNWMGIIYKWLHEGFDSLDEKEKRYLDTYFGWKIKTTLGDATSVSLPCAEGPVQADVIVIQNRVYDRMEIFRDLQSDAFLWMTDKAEKLKELSKEALWKRFNNHCFNKLNYQYKQKVPRESTMPGCDTYQIPRDYSDEDLVYVDEAAEEALPPESDDNEEI